MTQFLSTDKLNLVGFMPIQAVKVLQLSDRYYCLWGNLMRHIPEPGAPNIAPSTLQLYNTASRKTLSGLQTRCVTHNYDIQQEMTPQTVNRSTECVFA